MNEQTIPQELQIPSDRDRVVDLVRVASIAVVVFGHWLMAVVEYRDGAFSGSNALDRIPGVWALTWLLQVMPLFFFVGGFANATAVASAARRGTGYAGYLRARASRLLAPTIPFVAIWLAVALGAKAFGFEGLDQALAVVARPLWFLAVYVAVCALAPAMLALHKRAGWVVPASLAIAAAIVDAVARIDGLEMIGKANFAFTWLFAHQLGFFLADGTFRAWTRKRFAMSAAAAFAWLVALTGSGIYPASMVTLDEGRSNVTPPTICIVLLSVWLVSLVMLAHPALSRLLERPRAYKAVALSGSMLMTIFLWHLTALMLGALVLLPLGFPQPEIGSLGWWVLRPVWVGVLLLILLPILRGTARWEIRSMLAGSPASAPSVARALAGTLLLVAGFTTLAEAGFDHRPLAVAAAGALVAGHLLTSKGSRRGLEDATSTVGRGSSVTR